MKMRTAQNPLPANVGGLYPEDEFCEAVVDAGVTAVEGDVLAFDVDTVNSQDSVVGTVRVPVTGDAKAGMFCIAKQGGAAGTKIRVQVKGLTTALVAGTPAIGAPMGIANGVKALTAPADKFKVIAWMRQLGVDQTQKLVMFDGINGFGNIVA